MRDHRLAPLRSGPRTRPGLPDREQGLPERVLRVEGRAEDPVAVHPQLDETDTPVDVRLNPFRRDANGG